MNGDSLWTLEPIRKKTKTPRQQSTYWSRKEISCNATKCFAKQNFCFKTLSQKRHVQSKVQFFLQSETYKAIYFGTLHVCLKNTDIWFIIVLTFGTFKWCFISKLTALFCLGLLSPWYYPFRRNDLLLWALWTIDLDSESQP